MLLLLGHAAVSARRGPRGICQETRAAPWAPAECGVTARSASDGVDVNGIRVHHRRLQYRKYQCGKFSELYPVGSLPSHGIQGIWSGRRLGYELGLRILNGWVSLLKVQALPAMITLGLEFSPASKKASGAVALEAFRLLANACVSCSWSDARRRGRSCIPRRWG